MSVGTASNEPGGYRRSTATRLGAIVGASLVAMVLALAFGQDLTAPAQRWNDSYGRSALGHRAALALLERAGIEVEVSRARSFDKLTPRRALVVLEPQIEQITEAPGALPVRFVMGRALTGQPVLAVAPKRRVVEATPDDPQLAGRVALRSLTACQVVVDRLWAGAPGTVTLTRADGLVPMRCTTAWGEELEIALASAQLFAPSDDIVPLVWCDAGVVAARHPRAPFVLVSDPDLVSNAGIATADHAALLPRLISQVLRVDGVVVDETIHGHVTTGNPVREALRFPFVLLALHGCVVVALVMWAAMGRFGSPLPRPDVVESGRALLIDNTARLLVRGGHTRPLLAQYLDQVIRSLAAALAVSERNRARLIERLAAIGVARGVRGDLDRLVREVEALSGTRSSRPVLRIALALYRFREELLHGNRSDRRARD